MTTIIQNNNSTERITQDDEFNDPNVNYKILLAEIRQRIIDIQADLGNIKDPEIRGFATKLYTELKNNYFDLTKAAMDLEHDLVVEQCLNNMITKGDASNE